MLSDRPARVRATTGPSSVAGHLTQPDNNETTPLFVAVYNGHLAVVQWLAGNGGSVSQQKNVDSHSISPGTVAWQNDFAMGEWFALRMLTHGITQPPRF